MINWAPTTAEEVVQNVNTLLATEPGTVPFARDLGVPQDFVDMPQTTAGALVQAAAIKAIRTYEPRAPISKLTLVAGEDGQLTATITLGPSS